MESSEENCHLRELIRERLDVDEENVIRGDSIKSVSPSFQETLPTERLLPPSTDHTVPELPPWILQVLTGTQESKQVTDVR